MNRYRIAICSLVMVLAATGNLAYANPAPIIDNADPIGGMLIEAQWRGEAYCVSVNIENAERRTTLTVHRCLRLTPQGGVIEDADPINSTRLIDTNDPIGGLAVEAFTLHE